MVKSVGSEDPYGGKGGSDVQKVQHPNRLKMPAITTSPKGARGGYRLN